MRANPIKLEYLLELLLHSTLDKPECAVCTSTKEELLQWLRKELKRTGY